MREDLLISTIFWIKILLTRMYRKRVCTWCCFYHSTSSSSSFQQMQFFLFQYKWMHFIRSLFINLLGFDGLSKSTNNSNSSILPLKQKKTLSLFFQFHLNKKCTHAMKCFQELWYERADLNSNWINKIAYGIYSCDIQLSIHFNF